MNNHLMEFFKIFQMTFEVQTLVIDNGSNTIKAGFNKDETPRSVFRSVLGRIKCIFDSGVRNKDVFVGNLVNENLHDLTYPIERGIVKNWDAMEKIWHYAFKDELCVDTAEHPVLLTEPILNPKSNREKMVQLMFETFSVPSFYVTTQNVLSIYASGRTTGLSCNLGNEVSTVVPVYEGYSIPHSITSLNLGGLNISEYLQKLLNQKGHSFTTPDEKETIRRIKEECSYVALDYDSEIQKAKSSECEIKYKISDRNVVTIGKERFCCTEILFKPHMNGFDYDGIDKVIFNSIKKCDIDIHKEMYANIIPSGCSAMFEGLPERLEKEVKCFAPATMKLKIVAPKSKYTAWIGGSILAGLDTFPLMVIRHDEYTDEGPRIIHRKCF